MQTKLFLSLSFLAIILNCKGQYTFVTPVPHNEAGCEVMVNELSTEYFRDDLKRAVFRLYLTEANGVGAYCTGTMINRNTDLGHLGQYFVTAWHCFKSGTTCGGSVFDFANQYVTLTFNYQSTIDEGGLVFSPNQTGSVYSITRKVRLVDHVECGYGDFAICEILGDPIPPYYNVYYAGWNPNGLFVGSAGSDYAVIHQPMGDIKSMAVANTVVNNGAVNPVSLGCRVVTKLIDAIFGWIWGHRWSTEVVCGYLDVPFAGTQVTVPAYVHGLVEEGSSGSALLSPSNRMIGDLSAVVNTSCTGTNTTFYGKLANSYYRQSIKNTLNPSNSWQVDQGGIGGRDMTCYPQVNLDPGSGSFILYPAGLYQAYNHIDIVSQTTFTTASNKSVIVKANSSFTFQAGQSITFNPGFQVENGAEFNAVISPSPCSLNTTAYEAQPQARTPRQLDGMAGPVYKKFDISKYLKDSAASAASNFTRFIVYPNPSGGAVNIDLFLKTMEPQVALVLYDLNGKPVYSRKFTNLYYLKQPLDLPQLPAGMYNLVVSTGKEVNSRRIVVMR
jgi:hypothetical protein